MALVLLPLPVHAGAQLRPPALARLGQDGAHAHDPSDGQDLAPESLRPHRGRPAALDAIQPAVEGVRADVVVCVPFL